MRLYKNVSTSLLLSLAFISNAFAVDSYNPTSNELTIPLVYVGGTGYSNVVINVGDVVGISGGSPSSDSDAYNASNNQLTIPSVNVGGNIYTNVTVTVKKIISVDGRNIVSRETSTPLKFYASSYENAKEMDVDVSKLASVRKVTTETAFAIADFERTGNKDLIVNTTAYDPSKSTPQTAQRGTVKYFKQMSDGSYKEDATKIKNQTGCLHPRKAVVADFNADGKPDVFFSCHGYDANPFPGEVNKIALSQSDGSWYVTDVSADIGFWHSATAFDVDGDGDVDVMAVNGQNVVTFLNDGLGRFTKETTARVQGLNNAPYYSIEAINLIGDSYPELIIGGHEFEGAKTLILNGKVGQKYSASNSTTVPVLIGEGIVLDFLATGAIDDAVLWVLRTNESPFYNDKTVQRFGLKSGLSSVALIQKAATWAPWLFKYGNTLETYNWRETTTFVNH